MEHITNLIQQLVVVFSTPRKAWDQLKAAQLGTQELLYPTVFLMAVVYGLLCFLIILLSTAIHGHSTLFFQALWMGFCGICVCIGFTYLMGWLINLTGRLLAGGEDNLDGGMALATYGLIPIWVLPVLDVIVYGLIGSWGLAYLVHFLAFGAVAYLWIFGNGFETMMGEEKSKALIHAIVALGFVFVFGWAINPVGLFGFAVQ